MPTPKRVAAARREADRAHRTLADDVRRLREDAGVGLSDLAREAGVDLGFLMRIEEGRERPSMDTHAKLALALGADVGARLYPNTGPRIRDRHQARILEALLGSLHPRWHPYSEVAVRQPARGWIDVVLHEERERCVVAVEIESELRRLEQQVRWFGAKADALPSWDGFGHLGEIDVRSQLLLVRSTRATRAIGRAFARQLTAAYPAHPEDALAALTGTGRWPGPTLVWVDLRPERARLISHR